MYKDGKLAWKDRVIKGTLYINLTPLPLLMSSNFICFSSSLRSNRSGRGCSRLQLHQSQMERSEHRSGGRTAWGIHGKLSCFKMDRTGLKCHMWISFKSFPHSLNILSTFSPPIFSCNIMQNTHFFFLRSVFGEWEKTCTSRKTTTPWRCLGWRYTIWLWIHCTISVSMATAVEVKDSWAHPEYSSIWDHTVSHSVMVSKQE